MSVLPVLIYGDARLRQVAKTVDRLTPDIRALAADLARTMYAANGRGLAAPQVGRLLRLFVMDCAWKDGAERAPIVVLNPKIVARSSELRLFDEGCLSIPGVVVPVRRPAEVTLSWQDLDGAAHRRVFDGTEAVVVQHEIDHLDGILNIDRADAGARAEIDEALLALSA